MKFAFFGDYFATNKVTIDPCLTSADVSFINLESPITKRIRSITKAGPVIKGDVENLLDLMTQFPNKIFFNLANNHIGDYGQDGIIDTLTALNSTTASFGGVSTNNKIEPVFIGNTDVAVISMCERQFGISQLGKLGSTSFTADVYSQIIKLKKSGFFVIAALHCAEEMNQWVSPQMRRFFKSLVDVGVDIVYNTHTHVPAGFEKYGNGIILYGMGNFIIDYARWKHLNFTTKSLMFIWEDGNISHKWIECNPDGIVQFSVPIPEYIEDCNDPLLDDEYKLTALWQEYSVRRYLDSYSGWLSPSLFSITKRLIKTLIKRDWSYFNKSSSLLKYHLWSCESHRLAVECALGVLSGELKDCRNVYSKRLLDKYYQ